MRAWVGVEADSSSNPRRTSRLDWSKQQPRIPSSRQDRAAEPNLLNCNRCTMKDKRDVEPSPDQFRRKQVHGLPGLSRRISRGATVAEPEAGVSYMHRKIWLLREFLSQSGRSSRISSAVVRDEMDSGRSKRFIRSACFEILQLVDMTSAGRARRFAR